MSLPKWARPPVPGATHDDNYSVAEVVWTHPDGDVTVQLPPPVEPPAAEVAPVAVADPRDEPPGAFVRAAAHLEREASSVSAAEPHPEPPRPARVPVGFNQADQRPARFSYPQRVGIVLAGGGVVAGAAVLAAHLR